MHVKLDRLRKGRPVREQLQHDRLGRPLPQHIQPEHSHQLNALHRPQKQLRRSDPSNSNNQETETDTDTETFYRHVSKGQDEVESEDLHAVYSFWMKHSRAFKLLNEVRLELNESCSPLRVTTDMPWHS